MGWYEEKKTDDCKKMIFTISKCLDEKDKTINKFLEENKKLKDEHYKDKELKKLQEKIKELQENCNRGFPITYNEQKVIDEIREEHKKKCPYCSFSYIFEPYSIVTFGFLRCDVCGEVLKFAEW